MFLKNIEIFGFKSFADKSRIEFGDGISMIVGPNGCGKSNVVDAIRWVLGEQSSKGIRTEKMNEVIFNGTEQRHPLNVAEVTLTFSNEKNILPLEFVEISIKRRIFRSSNSEYFINGTQVTLKEIKELLADTGVGVTEYVVMEQGRIEQIIESKPKDRRGILEETAGIKKFRMRSAEGTRRREKVKENIIQIEQILHEVKQQHKTLKQQSEKAIQYRTLNEVIFSCEVTLVCKKYNEYLELLHKSQTKQEKIALQLQKEEVNQNKIKEENNIFQIAIKDSENNFIEHQRRLSVIQSEKEASKKMIKTNQEHIEEIKLQHNTQSAQLENYKLHKTDQEKEIKDLNTEKKTQQQNLKIIETGIIDNQKNITDNKKEINTLTKSREQLFQREERIRNALENHQRELRTVVDRLAEELEKRISQTGYSANLQNRLETKILETYQQITQKIQTLKNFLQDSSITGEKVIITTIKTHIENLSVLSNNSEKAFLDYKNTMPTFLNEFLENDGVLAHKHIIDEKIQKLHKEQEECRNLHTSINTSVENITQNNNALQKLVHEMEIQRNYYIQNLETIDKNEQRVQISIKKLDAQISSQDMQLKHLALSLVKWEDEYEIHEKKYSELNKENMHTFQAVEKLKKDIGLKYTKANIHQKKIEDSQNKILEIQNSVQFTREKIIEMEGRLQVLSDNFRDRYGELIKGYLNEKKYQTNLKKNVENIKNTLKITKEKIHLLGNVNLLAAEEFESIDSRFQHLSTQLQDLYDADTHLQEIIETIEAESRQKMEKTFEEVRKHFKTIFTRMMGGGKADLLLVDSEDILLAGLDIIAQPPEKKTKHLSQLSGGERTLIALSLLFALHSVKPAPFCLLDELDASLDDKNIDRFLELLHSFKNATQFVVISHNKRSIAQAKNIIGVTMEERGISKFIGVQLESNAKVI